MKSTTKAVFFILAALAVASGKVAAQSADESAAASNFAPPTPAASHEEELYNDATEDLDNGNYQRALEKFSSVAAMKGRRADAASYWKAYAQNKVGQRAQALATIAELRRLYPQSRWLKDAGALELEVKQAQGRPVTPESESDCDLKVMAINSLMNSEEDRAVTLLESVLHSNMCAEAKDKALFVLSQSESPRAQQELANMAKGLQSPELQRKAIKYLGINDSGQNKQLLLQLYNGTNDTSLKRDIIKAFLTSDAESELVSVLKTERDPAVRSEGIHTLGAMGATNSLHQMFAASSTSDQKEEIIKALGIADDVPFLAQVAKSPGDESVRREAIHSLGISGEQARPLLVEIYNSDRNTEIRDAAIEGLFVNDADSDLIALARKETDPQMKRRIIEKLSVMDSRKARDYMLEILNK